MSDQERPDIEGLYRQHRAGLVRLVERELHDRQDAEDVVQTAFLDAQRALERGTIPHNPRAWLAAIALNAARRLWRRQLNVEALEEFAAQEASRLPEIKAALTHLSRNEQAAVLYRDLLGLSYAETAEQMGTTVPAVTMLLHRARSRLRGALGSVVVCVGPWRWLRGSAWQATAVKAAGVVALAGGLGTAGVLTGRHGAGATAPTVARTAAAVSQGRRETAGMSNIGLGRSHAKRVELRSSARRVHTGRSSSGRAAPTSAMPRTTVQAGLGLSLASKASASVPHAPITPPLRLSVPTRTAPLLPPQTPPLPTATTTTLVAATVQTPVATVTVGVP